MAQKRGKAKQAIKQNAREEGLKVAIILQLTQAEQDVQEIRDAMQRDIAPSQLDRALEALQQSGMVERRGNGEKGSFILEDNFAQLKQIFLFCDRHEKAIQILGSPWMQKRINEAMLCDVTKDTVFATIQSVLRLLTSSNLEVQQDLFLSDLYNAIGQNEETYLSLGGIAGSLDEVGFMEYLQLSLSSVSEEDISMEKQVLIEQMAERDIHMFFGPDPPLPSLAEAFQSILFPKEERRELLSVLKASPSALRIILSARETRSGSFVSAAVLQTLPLLEHLFQLFAIADLKSCDSEKRRALDDELLSLLRDRMDRIPRPSPLLRVLKGRMLADRSSDFLV